MMTESVYALSSSFGRHFQPDFLGTSADDDLVDSSCIQGRLATEEHEFAGEVAVVATFINCEVNQAVINGQVVIVATLSGVNNILGMEASYRFFHISTSQGDAVFHGAATIEEERLRTRDLTFYNEPLDTTFYTDNFTIQYGEVNGRLYADTQGYIDVSTQNSGSNIAMEGANNSSQRAQLVRPYLPNDKPLMAFDGDLTVERETKLYVTALGDDPNGDYLRFEWHYLQGPDGCEAPFSTHQGEQLSLVVTCRGEHQLELLVQDGRGEHSFDVSYQVIAPPPQLSESGVKWTRSVSFFRPCCRKGYTTWLPVPMPMTR